MKNSWNFGRIPMEAQEKFKAIAGVPGKAMAAVYGP